MKKTLFFILCLFLTGIGMAQWHEDGNFLSGRSLYDFEAASLPDGSFYVVFNGPEKGNIVFSALYYDKYGKSIWDEEVMISNEKFMGWTQVNQIKAVDDEGNLIVAVSDSRHTDGQVPSYTAYKINKKGEMLWGENGIDLSKDFNSLTNSMNIIPLKDGSCIFTWAQKDGQYGYIRMQRLSATGEKLWGESGKFIQSSSEEILYPQALRAGSNEFIVVFCKGMSQDMYARKMDFDGVSVWGEDILVGYGTTLPNYPAYVVIAAEPVDGGLLLSWVDVRKGDENPIVCMAHVNTDGKHQFPDGPAGLQLGEFVTSKACMIYDKETKTFVTAWLSGQRIMAQRMTMSGEFLWEPDGKEVVTSDLQTGYLLARRAEAGHYGFFFMDNHFGNVGIRATLLDEDGQEVWPAMVTVDNYKCGKTDLDVTAFNGNQWVLLWDDERAKDVDNPTEGHHLYMKNLTREGLVGIAPDDNPMAIRSFLERQPNALSLSPNPVKDQAVIRFMAQSDGSARLSLYDLQGRLQETIFNGRVETGENTLDWQPKNGLEPGVYLLQLQCGKSVSSLKVVIK